MKENFEVQLLTWHKEGAGLIENVHNLDAEAWKQVEVVTIDIALDKKNLSANDYKEETDPRWTFNFIDFTFLFFYRFLTIVFRLYKHEPSGRGPLSSTWLTEIQQKCKSIEAAREMNLEQKEEMPQVMVSYIFFRCVWLYYLQLIF